VAIVSFQQLNGLINSFVILKSQHHLHEYFHNTGVSNTDTKLMDGKQKKEKYNAMLVLHYVTDDVGCMLEVKNSRLRWKRNIKVGTDRGKAWPCI